MHVPRNPRVHVPARTTARLHLLLALVAALSGTAYGLAAAAGVLLVLAAREQVRHRLAPGASGTVRARVLASPQRAPVLDPAGPAGQRLAG